MPPSAEDSPGHDLIEHLVRTTEMPAQVAAKVVAEVVEFFSEPLEDFVRRRHRELQAAGFANNEIFVRLRGELGTRPFRASELSERQLRRIVYG